MSHRIYSRNNVGDHRGGCALAIIGAYAAACAIGWGVCALLAGMNLL